MKRNKRTLSRADIVRQRREKQSSLKQAKSSEYTYRTTIPQPIITRRGQHSQVVRRRRGRFNTAFRIHPTNSRTLSIDTSHLALRVISFLLTAAIAYALYYLWTSPTYSINTAELHGNQRLGITEINASLGVIGEPIFTAIPKTIIENLRNTYLDLYNVEVHVAFPNRIIVEVIERTPVLVWYQEGRMAWIDAYGIIFMPRGEVAGLVPVVSSGYPPQVLTDPKTPSYEQPFISPDLVEAMLVLFPYVPGGTPLTYETQYGIGWQDTRGWYVYFGQNSKDITMKLQVYQAIVDKLTHEGIQPKLISVEYLEAPYYR